MVTFAATPEEHDSWKTQAEDDGKSFSAWAREKLNGGPAARLVHHDGMQASAGQKTLARKPRKPKLKDPEEGGYFMPERIKELVKPKDCTNRPPKGAFCKTCGSIHK